MSEICNLSSMRQIPGPTRNDLPSLSTLKRNLCRDSKRDFALEVFEIMIQIQGWQLDLAPHVILKLSGMPWTGAKPAIDWEQYVRAALAEKRCVEMRRTLEFAVELHALRRGGGRPADRRPAAIEAMVRHRFTGVPWRQLAGELCDCTNKSTCPSASCIDKLRKVADQVSNELLKYRIYITPEQWKKWTG